MGLSLVLFLIALKFVCFCVLVGTRMGKPKWTCCPVASDVTFGYVIIEIKMCFWDLMMISIIKRYESFRICWHKIQNLAICVNYQDTHVLELIKYS